MFWRIESSTDSIVIVLDQPAEVSISVQIEPPMVTWPVRKAKRGRSTRTYGGAEG